MTSLPDINTLIVVHVDGSDTLYRSRVEGVGDGMLTIALPSDGLTEHRLAHRTLVSVEWRFGRGIGSVDGIVAGHLDVGVPALQLQLVSEPIFFQRREHARGDVVLCVDIWPDAESDEPVTGVTLDVSGGGVRAVIETDLEPGELVRIAVHLREGPPVTGVARVVACRDESVVAFEFHEIVAADRERLIRTVFASYRGGPA
ncbi:MAG TPA: PilZ domain-containing protein [Gaiellaceae bacterium]|nr:PilZ domain-containing protein [Gaiellaceae bacterium]